MWLTSTSAGTSVIPNSIIDWQLWARVSPGDNHGLAGFSTNLAHCDIVDMRGLFDYDVPRIRILGGAAAPVELASFDRPLGIANPPPSPSLASGYGGWDVPDLFDPWETVLWGVGGVQNNSGVGLPATSPIAHQAIPNFGIGQSATGVMLASETLHIPPLPYILVYALPDTTEWEAHICISPTQTFANVFVSMGGAAQVSATQTAQIEIASPQLTFTVKMCRADFNGSGGISVQDIFDFLAAFYANDSSADINGNGEVTTQDIFDYLALFYAGC